ncbi:sulfotransferase family protein [Lutimaribacter sp. EGI FJ00015]|uniref:Sulfotransferase family protein n=1 Tax=Lutimaribacter degradans TaxID=2945989 RepID=A0ACC6A0A1_9RHOB|nr:sulfotransferase family 2 domain-containing protein [Lutimaribacter sp. EGI FJ00013]MCM2563598.1 sulfotransferase family protein [Lutimaribacter sp. EGI FJ00013]MCO0614738.1 sulfotransferase family protein [Lutimaribacter sp. EGI FJ00015]MCO0637408.1 sulfotransferase family protein [Lutimaribacter sp. EGI FJ00014]
MLVDHNKRVVSISVPKTGSTSLHYALMSALKLKFETNGKDPVVYHLSAADIRIIMGPRKFDGYFSFGVTRNPYDRMVSLYHDFHNQRGRIKQDTFEEFVLEAFLKNWTGNVHFRPQTFFLHSSEGQVTKEAFKFEDGLDAIMERLIEELELEDASVGHARKSERSAWQQYYSNPEVVKIVSDFYAADFKNFGYSTEISS